MMKQEPVWRYLKHGELIQKGDRILRGKEWDSVLNLWIGEEYDANNFMKIQRQVSLTAQQIPEGYAPHYLTGSYKTRSSNSLVGVIHAVRKCNGDNFNYSLCGKKPRPKSMGWHETRSEITCDKCKAMLSASQPKR
jgi:hypothetical protein